MDPEGLMALHLDKFSQRMGLLLWNQDDTLTFWITLIPVLEALSSGTLQPQPATLMLHGFPN